LKGWSATIEPEPVSLDFGSNTSGRNVDTIVSRLMAAKIAFARSAPVELDRYSRLPTYILLH